MTRELRRLDTRCSRVTPDTQTRMSFEEGVVAVLDLITGRTRTLIARLSPAAEDAAAAELGWRIERGPHGRRTYRDARFVARRAAALAELGPARRTDLAGNPGGR
jgi:hypothetical protein